MMSTDQHIDAFARAVRYHYANNPNTWTVVKVGAGAWRVINAAGDAVTSNLPRKSDAEREASPNGMFHRRWSETDRWYRGLSTDHRNRPLTIDEQDTVNTIINNHEGAN